MLFHIIVEKVIATNNKVTITGILNSKFVKDIKIDDINEIIIIKINLFLQLFSSSSQSFARIIPVGNPTNSNKIYNKFDSIIYLSLVVF